MTAFDSQNGGPKTEPGGAEVLTFSASSADEAYAKPSIQRLQGGASNKYGLAADGASAPLEAIDGVSVATLTQRFGSPLFVFSEATVRERVQAAQRVFSRRYPRLRFSWSYKTNYLDAIASIFHQEGCPAEVVSRMEYEKARRLGIPGDQIVFNGPNKSLEALRVAASEGARIHVDHFDEIDDLEQVARELGRSVPVALRLNLDSGIAPVWSRFGFNLESGQALDAALRIQAGGLLELVGLHCHIGTFVLDAKAYGQQVRKMVDFGYQLESRFGWSMQYFDFGGGFASSSRLKGAGLGSFSAPDFEAYAEAIGEALDGSLRPGHLPEVLLESGRALIDEAGFLITTAQAAKRLPDGRKAYVLDAGVNLLYTSSWYRFKVQPERSLPGVAEPSVLNGPLCMNIDVVDEGCLLPPLPRGTRLTLSPVGAYNVTQWMQFIEYRPAVVLITREGEPVLIREREDLSDLVGRERLPEHLRALPQHQDGIGGVSADVADEAAG